jgi:hypothetical protein
MGNDFLRLSHGGLQYLPALRLYLLADFFRE